MILKKSLRRILVTFEYFMNVFGLAKMSENKHFKQHKFYALNKLNFVKHK